MFLNEGKIIFKQTKMIGYMIFSGFLEQWSN
jgi:hypothetical protein